MSEVEKMYENIGIEPIKQGYCDWDSDCPYPVIINDGCGDECPYWRYEDEAKYPPFTAEKQLELIKWVSENMNGLNVSYDTSFNGTEQQNHYWCKADQCYEDFMYRCHKKDFSEALAGLINELPLSEEERRQIKEILE